jgi:hypothetical protein
MKAAAVRHANPASTCFHTDPASSYSVAPTGAQLTRQRATASNINGDISP